MTHQWTIGFYVDSVPITRAVIDGIASLGGSESACLGLARALKARGHDVHIIARQLDDDCQGPDASGLIWHDADAFPMLNQFIEWDVFVSLRMFNLFGGLPIRARLRLLWNQDMLTQPKQLMGAMWAFDQMVYVSEYQHRQYEDRLPELQQMPAFVTKNGFDPARVPAAPTKDPNRIIHISRPERGLRPLLAMWPAIRKANPHAEVRICRYSSMYDAQGWGKICASYDDAAAQVHAQVGGITFLGELGKGRLYEEIADAAAMWYPGVQDFAETSCIAAIEAQACGTPFVGSYKGALPETVPSGVLLKGNADLIDYQHDSVQAVLELLKGCADKTFAYRQVQKAGLKHVEAYTYDVIAAEWDRHIEQTFRARYQANKLGVMRQMLHDDDHVAARVVAEEIVTHEADHAIAQEAQDAYYFCDKVIAGQDQSAENYATHALNPRTEIDFEEVEHGRMFRCLPYFDGCTHVFDVACGNGSMAILLARAYPELKVTGIDYAEGNVIAARKAAEELGVGDRCTFIHAPFWDFDTQGPVPGSLDARKVGNIPYADGVFCGEFIEHVANCDGLVNHIEQFTKPGARVVFTCPHGPFTEMLDRGVPVHRGHVHQFCHDDLNEVFGGKRDLSTEFLNVGLTSRGASVGHWIVAYRSGGGPARPRNLAHRALTCRPMRRLSVGLIVGPKELDLRRCLDSVWSIADEIVVGDCGMDPVTRGVAEEFGARIVPVGFVMDLPEGFAGARNAVLAASTGEDFLWIDADERLIGGVGLRKYLESGPYVGYSLHQNHLMLDAQRNYDTPIRLFRKRDDIQFYGCVHEQPQMGDANGDIVPALEVFDISIAHTGYLVEPQRREKMLHRNLPLLKRDRTIFPERRLGKLLWLRDFINIADYKREQNDGEKTPEIVQLLKQTVALFENEFADPKDKYHALARPWYERALKDLGIGIEMELAIAGKRGGIGTGHAKPRRVWIRQHADLGRLLQHELDQIKAQMNPEALKVDPFDAPPPADEIAVAPERGTVAEAHALAGDRG